MKKIILTTFIFLFLSTTVKADMGFYAMDPTVWKGCNDLAKLSYISGVFDALSFYDTKLNGIKLSTKLSVDQYIDAIDRFYLDSKNSNVPIPILLYILNLEMSGVEKNLIESELIRVRSIFKK